MTYAEVLQIMGRPSIEFRGLTVLFGPGPRSTQPPNAVGYDEVSRTARDLVRILSAQAGLPVQFPAMLSATDWPVYFELGADGRVIMIRRGREGLSDPDSMLLKEKGSGPSILQP